jgi:chromate transporter
MEERGMTSCRTLFLTFARIGLFTFGGGYAMLPMIQREVVETKHWATDEQLVDYYAVGQCTPGVFAVNIASFVGFRQRGILGGLAATLGIISPSLVIIVSIAPVVAYFAEYQTIQRAMAGVRACVVALIANAIAKLWKTGVVDVYGVVICAGAFVLAVIFSVSPVYIVIAAALLGIIKGKAARGK